MFSRRVRAAPPHEEVHVEWVCRGALHHMAVAAVAVLARGRRRCGRPRRPTRSAQGHRPRRKVAFKPAAAAVACARTRGRGSVGGGVGGVGGVGWVARREGLARRVVGRRVVELGEQRPADVAPEVERGVEQRVRVVGGQGPGRGAVQPAEKPLRRRPRNNNTTTNNTNTNNTNNTHPPHSVAVRRPRKAEPLPGAFERPVDNETRKPPSASNAPPRCWLRPSPRRSQRQRPPRPPTRPHPRLGPPERPPARGGSGTPRERARKSPARGVPSRPPQTASLQAARRTASRLATRRLRTRTSRRRRRLRRRPPPR